MIARLIGIGILALACTAAQANERVAARVTGDWLLLRSDNLRTWVIQVRKHKEDRPGRSEFYAYYGANGERFPTPFDIVYETSDAKLVAIARIGATRIEASEKAENLFAGTLHAGGRSVPVRLERLPEHEIRKRAFNIPPIRKDARLEMIYLSTADCQFCAHWEAHAKGELLDSPAGKGLHFVEVKGDTLQLPIQAKHYPPGYRWVFEQVGATRGVPRFLLAIDGKVMLNAFGTAGYNDFFLPALKEVVARRAAGS